MRSRNYVVSLRDYMWNSMFMLVPMLALVSMLCKYCQQKLPVGCNPEQHAEIMVCRTLRTNALARYKRALIRPPSKLA